MNYESVGQLNFFSEMSERQISAREFFSSVLLDSLERNFGFKKILISYFDTQGKFLSWVNWDGIHLDGKEHPYRKFIANDVVRHVIHQEAVADQLTYFNVTPRLYKSTDIINTIDYEHSGYVRFLEENFQQHYGVTMAFGINAYIQVAFFKNQQEGDFTDNEIATLNKIYVYVANSYKNFKKHEQAKIVSNIQNEIISSGEKAYLITDDFMHIMSSNEMAQGFLKDILGPSITEEISSTRPCNWLPFLLGNEGEGATTHRVQTRVIKDYIFKIYTYDQNYSNGIIDTYHWITISQKEDRKVNDYSGIKLPLTQAEQKVAGLMYNGLTYQAIADELVISYHTVKKHIQNIYIKCGVNSRFQLYKWFEDK
ncbi:LuxR family transcriptional regulator [Klebsiella huaxiensis]|uniref:HTH-type transcriptional regulator MalT n=1 Tax=Klebsiella huaxiensis TaxID=2153354 RepID=A0A564HJA6_9ENTR|nr:MULTISPECIES: helix-turn-helix transcriptional regulator [Klebsiella]MDG1642679.1 helix-turn-helix transcriptional regulator [Klebsiella huaxiensis]QBG08814.1 LuxR family transcriptional regulator [Klebsiella huaxiensis]VUS32419.1 HTH-type transcriptional regulator MalT [Klebsiella huaxiensis]VUT09955.1 HTH-type transcriptional regulator MalT [Klebsiella huaxiensis]